MADHVHKDLRTDMFIDGEWTTGTGTGTIPTYDPGTGAVITEVPEATTADVNTAVEAAERAFESAEWAGMLPAARAKLLLDLADLLEAEADSFARLESTDQGQPLGISSGISVPNAVEHLRYYAGWATKITGVTAPLSVPDVDYRTRREPLGVCALITPWNFPLMILVWKLAPALATGNTVVVKPAEQTPLTTLRLTELVRRAGIPDGVVNVVTGGPGVGKALVAHPKVAKVSFTGSTEVGREIAARAGHDLKHVSLELGGKAPSIITADADIDAAVRGNLMGGLLNSGQVCAAYTRFFVDAARHDEFADKLAAGAASMRLGHGLSENTDLGPVVSAEQRDQAEEYVRIGRDVDGAHLHDRAPAEGEGYFVRPAVFSGVTDDMRIAREEIFGPVLSVLPYDNPDELVARANDTDYGLAAVVWSRDIGVANRLAARVRAGTVWINMPPFLDAAASWGGMKASGLGREMGWSAIEAFTQVKSVWTNLA
ncbi:aldehyde dehydrogenase family protein [Nocardiopsis metallicus]|uniref:Aldehyde dehydrogenase (NAD+)/betaine-aldehyde dehydrogenase n=1 Tax=Nocardiopsis metallicus TaxID=179819 RepID=A0A840WQB1_9ACTN|nr:aldehyde dehydrogenase family protein [Nocardiopsis metallicus]MBB5493896.1 aldehyde dehydrogenase (NAD+)/betaine-aldehyde dehydrogenase [Nocardiopsis metallicus]